MKSILARTLAGATAATLTAALSFAIVPAIASTAAGAPTPQECAVLTPLEPTSAADFDAVFACAAALDQEAYTSASWADVAAHIALYRDEWLPRGSAFYTAVAGNLPVVFGYLIPRANPTGALALIASLPSASEQSRYTAQSWAPYAQALVPWQALVNRGFDESQEIVDAAAGAVAIAALGLTEINPGPRPTTTVTQRVEVPVPGPTQTERVEVPGPTVTVRASGPAPTASNSSDAGPTGDNPQVDAAPPAATPRIKAAQTSVVLLRGKSLRVPAAAYAGTGAGPAVRFSSSAAKVAKVTKAGKITDKGVGRATITLKAAGAKSVKISVKVIAPSARKAKVARAAATGVPKTMAPGKVAWAAGKYAPASASGVKVTYRSSAKAVVTVDATGRIIARAPGKATITVKAGAKTKKYPITVR